MHATLSRLPRPQRGRAALPSARVLGTCLMAAGLLASCVDDDDPVSNQRVPTVARFAPSAGVLPVPNDLLFAGSADETLNIPLQDPPNPADPAIALNTLDGWSTTAPIAIEFSRPLDRDTVVAGSSIFLFEVTAFPVPNVGGPVQTVDAELQENSDYVIAFPDEGEDRTLVIQPVRPLKPSQAPNAGGSSVYMVIVTNGVTDLDGEPVQRDTEYLFAAVPELGGDPPPELLALNGLVNSHLEGFVDFFAPGVVAREDVVLSFTFTTQSIFNGLQNVFGIAGGPIIEQSIIDALCMDLGTCGADTGLSPFSIPQVNQVNVPESFLGTAAELLGGAPGVGNANIFVGVFKAPYYLDASMNASFAGLTNDSASLSTRWRSRYARVEGDTARNVTRFNPLPVAKSCQQMPLLISIPEVTMANPMPPNGWPVVIFQHGIGGSRAAMLFVAEALAAEGLAAVAIDLPLHGWEFGATLPDGTTELFLGYDNALPETDDVWERTFGIDLLTEVPGELPVPGPDMVADSSGAHFINLSNLAATRDNIRQGVSDLINLRAVLESLTVQGANMVIDHTQVHFMGHSLGGIVGTLFVALQEDLVSASLGMAGASLPYLLNGSARLGPGVRGGLANAEIVEGSPEFSQFLAAAQGIIDSADPINYADLISMNTTPIYFAEIVGGGPMGSEPDQVVPNSVPGAPFAGSRPLTQALTLTQASMSVTTMMGDPPIRAVVRFTEGNHSTLLAPNLLDPPTPEEIAAFAELQAQISGFHGSFDDAPAMFPAIPMSDLSVVD